MVYLASANIEVGDFENVDGFRTHDNGRARAALALVLSQLNYRLFDRVTHSTTINISDASVGVELT